MMRTGAGAHPLTDPPPFQGEENSVLIRLFFLGLVGVVFFGLLAGQDLFGNQT